MDAPSSAKTSPTHSPRYAEAPPALQSDAMPTAKELQKAEESYWKAHRTCNNTTLYSTLYPLLQILVKSKNPEFMTRLAEQYAMGLGCEKNIERALYWYQSADDLGYNPSNTAYVIPWLLYGNASHEISFLTRAKQAFADGNYKHAFPLFNLLAEYSDNPESQYYLGVMYQNGWGVTKNHEEATKCFKEARPSLEPENLKNLKASLQEKAQLAFDTEDNEAAHNILMILVNIGNLDVKDLHLLGLSKTSPQEIIRFVFDLEDLLTLGNYYSQHSGFLNEALQCYKEAVDKEKAGMGEGKAQYTLALHLMKYDSKNSDIESLLVGAHNAGHQDALQLIHERRFNKTAQQAFDKKDYQTAFSVWGKLPNLNVLDWKNLCSLGLIYLNGWGSVAQSDDQALRYLEDAFAKCDPTKIDGFNTQLLAVAEQALTDGNYKTALALFKLLADKGELQSLLRLELMHIKRPGVEQSDSQTLYFAKIDELKTQLLAVATQAFSDENYEKAFVDCKLLLDLGVLDANCLRNLGFMYLNGLGTKQDDDQAIKHSSDASNLGHPTAMLELGEFYLKRHDLVKATEYFQKAIKDSGEKARYGLAVCLFELKPTDHQISLHLDKVYQNVSPAVLSDFKKWALNLTSAQQALEQKYYAMELFWEGMGYMQGSHGEQSDTKAKEFLMRADNAGHSEAMDWLNTFQQDLFNNGVRYMNGSGVDQNDKKAKEFLMRADNAGHPNAMIQLNTFQTALYEFAIKYMDSGKEQSFVKAENYLRRAIEAGHPKATQVLIKFFFDLGLNFMKGSGGVKQNDALAEEYLRKAHAEGHPTAMRKLADFFSENVGGFFGMRAEPRNAAKARECFAAAVARENEMKLDPR
jgi:TPR repeat protein